MTDISATTSDCKANFAAILRRAGLAAMQWRLLLLWLAAMLVPTALMALPVWRLLLTETGHSVRADELAQGLDMNSIFDLMVAFSQNGLALLQAGFTSLLAALLLSPLLSGMAIGAARTRECLTLVKLVQLGVADYGRMLRVLVVAIVPFAIAGGLGAAALQGAQKYAETAVLEAHADWLHWAALAWLAALLCVAHATVEATRAQLAVDFRRRSALKAWWLACQMAVRHPGAVFGAYLTLTVVGLVLIGLIGLLRINLSHAGTTGFIFGLLLSQALSLIAGWMHNARLFALIDLAKAGR